jgi:hypothetical protein
MRNMTGILHSVYFSFSLEVFEAIKEQLANAPEFLLCACNFPACLLKRNSCRYTIQTWLGVTLLHI